MGAASPSKGKKICYALSKLVRPRRALWAKRSGAPRRLTTYATNDGVMMGGARSPCQKNPVVHVRPRSTAARADADGNGFFPFIIAREEKRKRWVATGPKREETDRSVASCGYDFEVAYRDARTCAA